MKGRWAEKYRPQILSDVVGNDKAKTDLRAWAKTWNSKTPPKIKAAIISGPPGVGKTTSAIALAREFGWDFIEMNASDKRGEKEIRRVVIPGSGTNTFAVNGDYFSLEDGKRHLIILDEADNIHSREDRGGIAALIFGGVLEFHVLAQALKSVLALSFPTTSERICGLYFSAHVICFSIFAFNLKQVLQIDFCERRRC